MLLLTYYINGWSALRNNRTYIKILGIIMAIIGAVIIVHTVPVFAWYLILLGLVLALGFVKLFM